MLKVLGKDQEYIFEKEEDIDLVQIKPGQYHLIRDGKSYNLEVVKSDLKAKEFEIKVNGTTYSLTAKDRLDLLLEDLGMEGAGQTKLDSLLAPMPGLVLDIMIEADQTLAKGDPLLILEAMKMENVIKSPEELKVDKVEIKKGQAVEKGEVLVRFKS